MKLRDLIPIPCSISISIYRWDEQRREYVYVPDSINYLDWPVKHLLTEDDVLLVYIKR